MDTLTQVIIWLIIFAIGAAVFSFLNVVIYRLPEGKSLVDGHSLCKSCGHELNMKDLIPVFSYIFLGGKCRYCKSKISFRYFFVEILGGIIAVGLNLYYGFSLQALLVFLFFADMTVITFIDNDTMTIPPQLNFFILGLGVIAIFVFPEISILDRVIGMFSVSLFLFIIVTIVPGGFGGGDIKLMFAAGFLLGWKSTVIAFFIGLVIGGAYGAVSLVKRKMGKKDHFAFGPFLCVGLAIAWFYGNQIMEMYLSSFTR